MYVEMAGRAYTVGQFWLAEVEIQVTSSAGDHAVFAIQGKTCELAVLKVERVLGRSPPVGSVAGATADVDGQISVRVNEATLSSRDRR
jgi:hypothetical protein